MKENGEQNPFKRQDLFVFVRQTMCIAAMYPFRYYFKVSGVLFGLIRFLDVIYEIFNYFVSVHIAALFMCTIYLNYGKGDLDFFVSCLIQTIIYSWMIAMKLYFRRFRPSLLDEIVKNINEKYEPRSAIGFSHVNMDGSYRMSRLWIKTYVYCCYIGTIFWLALPIAYRDKSLPLACWYPFDYTVSYMRLVVGRNNWRNPIFSATSGLWGCIHSAGCGTDPSSGYLCIIERLAHGILYPYVRTIRCPFL